MADPKYGTKSGGNYDTSETGDQNETDYKSLYEELKSTYDKDILAKNKSYEGLQGSLQKKDDALKAAEDQVKELTKQFGGTKADLDKIMAEKETLTTTLSEKEAALTSAKTIADRASIIMKDYPGLAAFEAKGLLPQSSPGTEPEKVKEMFKNFQDTLSAITGKAATQTAEEILTGTFPKTQPDSTDTADKGTNVIATRLKEMQTAALQGDTKAYDLASQAYLDAKYAGKPVEIAP